MVEVLSATVAGCEPMWSVLVGSIVQFARKLLNDVPTAAIGGCIVLTAAVDGCIGSNTTGSAVYSTTGVDGESA